MAEAYLYREIQFSWILAFFILNVIIFFENHMI